MICDLCGADRTKREPMRVHRGKPACAPMCEPGRTGAMLDRAFAAYAAGDVEGAEDRRRAFWATATAHPSKVPPGHAMRADDLATMLDSGTGGPEDTGRGDYPCDDGT